MDNIGLSMNLKEKISPMINSIAIKKEFFALKLVPHMNSLDKSFKNVSSMMTWNHPLDINCENLYF